MTAPFAGAAEIPEGLKNPMAAAASIAIMIARIFVSSFMLLPAELVALGLTLTDLGGVGEGIFHAAPDMAGSFDGISARPQPHSVRGWRRGCSPHRTSKATDTFVQD